MDDNIITMPTPLNVLADHVRAAYGRTQCGRQEWIEGTLELAAALAEARARFKANREFSYWIVDAELEDINHQDRAALICMADDLALARIVLVETKSASWRLIWLQEMKPRLTSAGKTDLPSQNRDNPPSNQGICAEAPAETTSSPTPLKPSVGAKPVSKRSPFHRQPRADEVTAVYLDANARSNLGKIIHARGGNEIWSLILAAIDAGFLSPTNTAFSKATLRILFPAGDRAYCGRFDLADAKHRQHVRDRVIPAALASREAVIATPAQLENVVAAYWRAQQDTARAAAAKQQLAAAVRTMPADQREVVMYGERLWPRMQEQFIYDFDQLCAAIWYFRDIEQWLQASTIGRTPESRAIYVRLSTKWTTQYIDRAYAVDARLKIKRVYQLVHVLAGLLEKNPAGECVIPPSPNVEGQYA